MNTLIGAFVIMVVWSDISHGIHFRPSWKEVSVKPNTPVTRLLAEQSLGQYLVNVQVDSFPLKLVEVQHATLTYGSTYRLNFTASPLAGHYPANLFSCFSTVSMHRENDKKLNCTVNCDLSGINEHGGPTEGDVTDPTFLYYAQKALDSLSIPGAVVQKVIKVTHYMWHAHDIVFLKSTALEEYEKLTVCYTTVTLLSKVHPLIVPASCPVRH